MDRRSVIYNLPMLAVDVAGLATVGKSRTTSTWFRVLPAIGPAAILLAPMLAGQ